MPVTRDSNQENVGHSKIKALDFEDAIGIGDLVRRITLVGSHRT